MADPDVPSVLIVDDDPQVRDLFANILASDYEVHVADSGEAAIETIGPDIDVCLVDRRMPGLAGGDVVRRFREDGFDQPVAMVTAVEPDFDVIDLGFDDYVVKPVDADDLREVVESLVLARQYDDVLREYFSLASKVTTLQASKSPEALSSNEDYRRTVDQLNRIKQDAKHSLDAAIDAGLLEGLLWESFLEAKEVALSATK